MAFLRLQELAAAAAAAAGSLVVASFLAADCMIAAGLRDTPVDRYHTSAHNLVHTVHNSAVAGGTAVAAVAGIGAAGRIGYTLRMPVVVRNTVHTLHRTTDAVVAAVADLAEMSARLAEMFVLVDSRQYEGFVGFVRKGLRRVRLARLPTSRHLS